MPDETGEIATRLVPGPVKYTVLLPPGYDAKGGPYPLLLLLHGGDGDNGFLSKMKPTIEAAWAAGDLPPLVVVTPDAQRSLYMDYRDGSQKWETFIVTEFLAHIRAAYRVSPDRTKTVVSGISMGGLGSLRLGLDHPEIFGGLAALEAGIEPALSFDAIKVRNSFQRNPAFFAERFGDPVDRAYWQGFNPANIAIARRDAIVKSGLQIYLEAGDADMFHLDEGNEFLHRVLWDHGIAHEYRLVHGADHLGRTIPGRLRDGFRFLNAACAQSAAAGQFLCGRRGDGEGAESDARRRRFRTTPAAAADEPLAELRRDGSAGGEQGFVGGHDDEVEALGDHRLGIGDRRQ